jgi:hypothetical protein
MLAVATMQPSTTDPTSAPLPLRIEALIVAALARTSQSGRSIFQDVSRWLPDVRGPELEPEVRLALGRMVAAKRIVVMSILRSNDAVYALP